MKVKEGERMKYWLLKKEKGITLVALVITIIVLLILAGVSIATLTGDNGILTKASEAKEKTEAASRKEQDDIEEILSTLDDYEGGSLEGLTKDQKVKYVNSPRLLSGMKKIMFKDPTDTEKGATLRSGDEGFLEDSWYNYDDKKWANVETEDGSMWVWIPRFAYKINSVSQTVDVKFLIGTTDKYFDEEGNEQTAKRVKEGADTSTDYYVHPAFTNEKAVDFKNGGWDKELRGIWVAKFEAGYAQGNNDAVVKETNLTYSQTKLLVSAAEAGNVEDRKTEVEARNWLDGKYGSTQTTIKYPVFMGTTYSMNYINNSDAFLLAKKISAAGNPYGLSTVADSHLMKDSEWGAVAYLSQSQYGLNGTDIAVNNVNLNSGGKARTSSEGKTGVESVYVITGVTTNNETSKILNGTQEIVDKINEVEGNTPTTDGIYTWKQKTGIKASSTGTIYGIYDLSGGMWEKMAAYIANGNDNLNKYGASLTDNGTVTKSTKYTMAYRKAEQDTIETNYKLNKDVLGNAIAETSIAATDNNSWYNDRSVFFANSRPFSFRGGYWGNTQSSGLFNFNDGDGSCDHGVGFRAVLVGV